MDPVSSENLRRFLENVRNAGLSERILSWRKIQAQGETAVADVQQLRARMLEMEREIERHKGEVVRIGEELRHAEEEHRKAMQNASLHTGITRHDVLNQVTIIDGYLSLAESRVSDPQLALFIKKGREAADAIQQHIRYTRSYQDIGVLRPVWQNIKEYTGKSVAGFQTPGVSVSVNCPPDLEILADPLLEKVLDGLLDNSLRHGERVNGICVSSSFDGVNLVIAWEDNGVGIAPRDKEKIFERGPVRHQYDLFLFREILGITGITIRETGTYGTGARFEMTIPKGKYRFTGCKDTASV